MHRTALLLALAAACALPAPAAARPRPRAHAAARAAIVLDGAATPVRFTDGDSLVIEAGPLAGTRARLLGVNALETFGPAHRWGAWSPVELLRVARAAAPRAAAGRWRCTTAGARDGYGRLLVACPDLALALVGEGLAMVFAVDARADPALLAAQRAAQEAGAGMWAKGVPARIVTSVHSAGEPGLGARGPYDRLADTRTGEAIAVHHARAYRICEEVCHGEGAARSCLLHVPFARRYRGRPACLR